MRRDGSYFGTLCAFDPEPTNLNDEDFEIFQLLSQLIAFEIEADERQRRRGAEVRALEDVVAIAAHDLRQPLTILSGRAELLARRARRGMEAGELAAGLDIIVAQARRATRLSEALLDMAQIEMGGFTVSLGDFDLVELARQAIEDAHMGAPSHTFRLEAPPSLTMPADERRIGQVLRNLLDNAAKYAPADSGPVILSVRDDKSGGQAPTVQICIRDHGPGVPDADLERIFERQYRTQDAEARRIRGTGLGLYSVRQIVQAHGGTVGAENAPDGGLKVCVDLPQATAG